MEKKKGANVKLKKAEKDGVLPDNFYSTSNQKTFIYLDGKEREVEKIKMDGCIVINTNQIINKSLCIKYK